MTDSEQLQEWINELEATGTLELFDLNTHEHIDVLRRAKAAVDRGAATAESDIIEARGIVKATLTPENHERCNCRQEIDAGEWDRGQKVRAALAGIQRGRVLAAISARRQEQAHG